MSDLIKDRECIECVHILMCAGKPIETERCIKFEQRESSENENRKRD